MYMGAHLSEVRDEAVYYRRGSGNRGVQGQPSVWMQPHGHLAECLDRPSGVLTGGPLQAADL